MTLLLAAVYDEWLSFVPAIQRLAVERN